jgi:hypothetical protein
LVALSLTCVLMGPNTRTVYLLDIVMRRIDSVLVLVIVIVLIAGDPSESLHVTYVKKCF